LKVYTRKCVECKQDFTVSGHAAGRRKRCSKACQDKAQARWSNAYQTETYNPWKWENTILEWNE
jgi:hypothetical protein